MLPSSGGVSASVSKVYKWIPLRPGGARGHFPGVNRPPKVPERVRGVPERGSCTFPR